MRCVDRTGARKDIDIHEVIYMATVHLAIEGLSAAGKSEVGKLLEMPTLVFKVNSFCLKVAVTLLSPSIVTTQFSLPEQTPLQPSKV